MSYIFVFFATMLADWFWAQWGRAIVMKQAPTAAFHSVMIILCGGFTIVEYTSNHWLLIPAALGAALGTYVAVREN
jgi:hypothetical protein